MPVQCEVGITYKVVGTSIACLLSHFQRGLLLMKSPTMLPSGLFPWTLTLTELDCGYGSRSSRCEYILSLKRRISGLWSHPACLAYAPSCTLACRWILDRALASSRAFLDLQVHPCFKLWCSACLLLSEKRALSQRPKWLCTLPAILKWCLFHICNKTPPCTPRPNPSPSSPSLLPVLNPAVKALKTDSPLLSHREQGSLPSTCPHPPPLLSVINSWHALNDSLSGTSLPPAPPCST